MQSEPEEAPGEGPERTPMMRQYLGVKDQHPDAIILMRMGDFFEAFYEDAKTISQLLDLTLTARSKEKDPTPMAGVPHHAVDGYIARLVELGKTVVLVDQVEDPRKAKGLVRREITRILSPGTFVDPGAPPRAVSYLVALSFAEHELPPGAEAPPPEPKSAPARAKVQARRRFGLALLEVSTGEFRATSGEDADVLIDELRRLNPREIVVSEQFRGDLRLARIAAELPRVALTHAALSEPPKALAARALGERLGSDEATALSSILSEEAIQAAGLALDYAERTQLAAASFERQAGGNLGHVAELRPYVPGDALVLDPEAITHLELFRTQGDGSPAGSLLFALDEAVTAVGGRLLRRWLARPLVDLAEIRARQQAVADLVSAQGTLDELRAALREIYDLERLIGRVAMGRSTPRDLAALRSSLGQAPRILGLLRSAEALRASEDLAGAEPPGLLARLASTDALPALAEMLTQTLVDDPSTELGTGRVFRTGFDPELDRLIALSERGKEVLLEIERRERERTGISSLKIRYNRVFGYFIEITKANLRAVPSDYIRKQTTAGGERYYTEELKTYEEQISSADDLRIERERELFQKVVRQVAAVAKGLMRLSHAIATADVLASLAYVAERRGYCRPEVDGGDRIEIGDGRHPVIERLAEGLGEAFVPNDLEIGDGERLMIITGPNMAGKSTIMRQTALLVLLAQMGSFVPAKRARVGLVDRIFTRVGASDDLSRGRSTFMVEMSETARILRAATRRSLILLDEIGRGTSTFDGLSIAWAVAEHIHDVIGAKTLFATHYHELTEICRDKPHARNFHVEVKEWKDRIVFLRKLVAGPTNRSYGVQVARLAGLPKPVVDRARAVLDSLEAQNLRAGRDPSAHDGQLLLFGAKTPIVASAPPPRDPISEALLALDLDELSPRQAYDQLRQWRDKLLE